MYRKLFLILAVLVLFLSTGTALAEDSAPAEPVIRVGIAKTPDPIIITASTSLSIWFGGAQRIVAEPNSTTTISFKAGWYTIKSGDIIASTEDPVRFVPLDATFPLTIVNLKRALPGHQGREYNTYRGIIEYRFSPRSNLPYLINELPLEDYLKGLAETAPNDPEEFLKAVVVAARSYAFAHISPRPPTDSRLFDVFATTQDQLYLGYNSELRLPEVASAASATRGEFVAYNHQPVITTYFSHSNGKTKTWTKKLGARPWIAAVKAPYDKGQRQSGHGYGMSLHDAREHAKRDSWTYQQILEYYYTGVAIEKLY